MGIWDVNAATDLISSMAQSTLITDSNSANNIAAGNFANDSDYAKILAGKIAELDSEMNNQQNNSAGQQGNSSKGETSDSIPMIETLRRIMPDGSLRIVTYKDGEIIDQMKIRTHLVVEPDYSAPPTPEGEPALKEEQRLSLAALLMA